MSKDFPIHPAAAAFPLMSGDEFESFKQDIKQNGQLVPIEILDGQVIDGRNRLLACEQLGVKPATTKIKLPGNKSAVSYVVSKNIHRRHLTTSQRAMIAAKLASLTGGRPSKTSSNDGVSRDEASSLLNVSTASIDRAKQVIESCSPEIQSLVEAGEVSVSAALEVAEYIPDKREQSKLAKQGADAVLEAVRIPDDEPEPIQVPKQKKQPPGVLGELHNAVYAILPRVPREMLGAFCAKLNDMADDILEEHGR